MVGIKVNIRLKKSTSSYFMRYKGMESTNANIVTLDNDKTLAVNYHGRTNHILYCIADFTGNVVERGNLEELYNSRVCINKLKAGIYTFCIVDGDSLTTQRFQKN